MFDYLQAAYKNYVHGTLFRFATLQGVQPRQFAERSNVHKGLDSIDVIDRVVQEMRLPLDDR